MVKENLNTLRNELASYNYTLVAVTKTKPLPLLQEAYEAGERHFGENKVQELVEKQSALPADIHWHMIGHLQTNKVKYIAPFVYLIHGVDSLKLLKEINKQAQKCDRVISVLLQVHIAQEETKFGFSTEEVRTLLGDTTLSQLANIKVVGLMGMASNTENEALVKEEFEGLYALFEAFKDSHALSTLSMGMSGDYKLALDAGSNMIRVGSLIFGNR